MRIKLVLAAICCCGFTMQAQEPGNKPPQNKGDKAGRNKPRKQAPEMPEPGMALVRTEFRFGGKVIKNAPYSAEAITESTQVLANGAKLSQKNVALVYRDGEGRTRREQSAAPVGPFATSTPAQRVVFLSDPVAGLAYTLYPDSRIAYKSALPPAETINAADPKAAPPPEQSER